MYILSNKKKKSEAKADPNQEKMPKASCPLIFKAGQISANLLLQISCAFF